MADNPMSPPVQNPYNSPATGINFPSFTPGALAQTFNPAAQIQYPGSQGPYAPGYHQTVPSHSLLSGAFQSQAPGNIGFAGRQNPFGLPGLAGMAMGLVGGPLMDAAMGTSVAGVAFGGTNGLSRYSWEQSRQRQNAINKYVPDLNVAGYNNLGLSGQADSHGGRIGAAVMGHLDPEMRTAAFTGMGRMGRVYGGSMSNQALGAVNSTLALSASMSTDGRLDRTAMRGMELGDISSGISSAVNMRKLGITGQEMRDINTAMSSTATEEEQAAGISKMGKRGREVAGLMAAGRDVYGKNASMEDIFANVQDTFGAGALKDPATATKRLREIDAAKEVLNMDQKTVTEYIKAMKQVAGNMGIVGEGNTTRAAMAMINNVEGIVNNADKNGVQLDKDEVAANVADAAEKLGGSDDTKQMQVMFTQFEQMDEESLRNTQINLKQGGTATGLQARDQANKLYAEIEDPNTTKEQKYAAMQKLSALKEDLIASGTPLGKEIMIKSQYYDEFENAGAEKQVGALQAEKNVYTRDARNREEGMDKMRNALTDLGQDDAAANMDQRVNEMAEAGVFALAATNDRGGTDAALEKLAGGDKKLMQEYKAIMGVSVHFDDTVDPETARKSLDRATETESSQKARADSSAAQKRGVMNREVQDKVASAMFPTGGKDIIKRAISAIAQARNDGSQEGTTFAENLTKHLNDNFGISEETTAALEKFQGDEGAQEAMGKELEEIEAGDGTQDEKAERTAAAIRNRFGGFQEEAVNKKTGEQIMAAEAKLLADVEAREEKTGVSDPATEGAAGGVGGIGTGLSELIPDDLKAAIISIAVSLGIIAEKEKTSG